MTVLIYAMQIPHGSPRLLSYYTVLRLHTPKWMPYPCKVLCGILYPYMAKPPLWCYCFDSWLWEPRLPRIPAADISTKWLHHHILLSIIILFWTLNPWKTRAQMPKKISRWEPRLPGIPADDISITWLRHYILLSIIILFWTLYPWKTAAQMSKKISRWEPRLPGIPAYDISIMWLHHHILFPLLLFFEH